MQHIHYYCFDIDDNILHMSTKINMLNLKTNKEKAVSSEEFAEIRSDKDNWKLADDAFVEFRDNGPRGSDAFLEDLKKALKNEEFGPSWTKFIECLENGSLFALITARGHAPESLRKGIEYIIDNYLDNKQKETMYNNLLLYLHIFDNKTDKYKRLPNLKNFTKNELVKEYLDLCEYYGVSNPDFVEKHKSGGAESPEVGKEIALKEFIAKVNKFAKSIGVKMSFGMSDDDIRNVTHVEKVFNDLKKIYPDTIFRLYDTSKRGYTKKVIENKLFTKFETFMESKVIK